MAKVNGLIKVDMVGCLVNRFRLALFIQSNGYLAAFGQLLRVYMVNVGICLARFNHGAVGVNGAVNSNVNGVFDVPFPVIDDVILQYPFVASVNNIGAS